MQYGAIKDRVRDAIGEPSDLDTQIVRWIDDALLEIHSAGRWPWTKESRSLFARGVLTTVTGDLTNDSTTINNLANQPVQGVADDYVGGLIRAGGNVYVMDSWTVSTSIIVLKSAVVSVTAATEALDIGEDLISLSSDIDSVFYVNDTLQPLTLSKYSGAHNRYYPDPFDMLGAIPDRWSTLGVDSSGNVRLRLMPMPDEDRSYLLEVSLRPLLLEGKMDTVEVEAITGIPQKFHKIICARAIYEAKKFEYERPDQAGPEFSEYMMGIKEMRAYGRTDAGKIHRLGTMARSGNIAHRKDLNLIQDYEIEA